MIYSDPQSAMDIKAGLNVGPGHTGSERALFNCLGYTGSLVCSFNVDTSHKIPPGMPISAYKLETMRQKVVSQVINKMLSPNPFSLQLSERPCFNCGPL